MSPPVSSPDFSVVIPVFNEAGNIGALLSEIFAAFEDDAVEVIVVDDDSADASRDDIAAGMAGRNDVRLLRHGRRSGKSRALFTGFAAARGDWIGTLDGDGQNDPRDLARIWRKIRQDPPNALIAGVRQRRNDGVVKWLTSRTANIIRKWLLRDDCRDAGCGLKLMPARFARELPYFDNMHRFFPALARRAGLDVLEEPIDDRPRQHGVSKYGFFDRASVAFLDTVGVFWLIRRHSDPRPISETAPPVRSKS